MPASARMLVYGLLALTSWLFVILYALVLVHVTRDVVHKVDGQTPSRSVSVLKNLRDWAN